MLSEVKIAGPGFINTFLSPTFVNARVQGLVDHGVRAPDIGIIGKKVILLLIACGY